MSGFPPPGQHRADSRRDPGPGSVEGLAYPFDRGSQRRDLFRPAAQVIVNRAAQVLGEAFPQHVDVLGLPRRLAELFVRHFVQLFRGGRCPRYPSVRAAEFPARFPALRRDLRLYEGHSRLRRALVEDDGGQIGLARRADVTLHALEQRLVTFRGGRTPGAAGVVHDSWIGRHWRGR